MTKDDNYREGIDAFLNILNAPDWTSGREAAALFDTGLELTVARAPGRLDVMGGIADYSGSVVLQWPIREATYAVLQPSSDGFLTIVSTGAGDDARSSSASVPISVLTSLDYSGLCAYFADDPERHWSAYVAGPIAVLMKERGLKLDGARILISSTVPEGKGVSSSAAIEVATLQATSAAYGIAIGARDTALLCQKAENLVVGAPCGVMDQMTSSAGLAGRFLALHCQPAELLGFVELPKQLTLWGIDSGIRHAVTGADYGSVRAAAFMGYRILRSAVEDGQAWNGYLANISPSELIQKFERHLPERISGADFLAQYDGVDDPISIIRPEREYAVRAAAGHPIYENFRVRTYGELLAKEFTPETGLLLGELMYQSHAGYSACGIGSDGTDRIVESVREAGSQSGLYGAKITGGGSGGTVAVLGDKDAGETVQAIADAYGEETGTKPYVFTGSSDGAAKFGTVRLRHDRGGWVRLRIAVSGPSPF